MIKRIVFFVTVFVCLLIINDLVHEIVNLWQKQSLISQTQQQLVQQQQENKKLKQQLAQAGTQSFVEEQARDELFLTKPGQETVVLPQQTNSQSQPQQIVVKPNWQQWLQLFFN